MNRKEPLPACFGIPQAARYRQQSLFKRRFVDVLAELEVSMDDLVRWHGEGWLSTNGRSTTEVDDFDDPLVWEITVIRDVVRAGLGDAHVRHLIARLPKPAAIDPSRLAYSFRHGWVAGLLPVVPDPDEVVEEHLDAWLDDQGLDRLLALQARIAELVQRCNQDSVEGPA